MVTESRVLSLFLDRAGYGRIRRLVLKLYCKSSRGFQVIVFYDDCLFRLGLVRCNEMCGGLHGGHDIGKQKASYSKRCSQIVQQ